MSITDKQAAYIRNLSNEVANLKSQVATSVDRSRARAITPEEELNRIPGRRMNYIMSGYVDFVPAQSGNRGESIQFPVSQDGPFVATHMPSASWAPIAPALTPNVNGFRPPTIMDLATQEVSLGGEFVDISWELQDGGTQRLMQSAPVPADQLSQRIYDKKMAMPTLFAPSTIIQFTPTYNRIVAVTTTTFRLFVSIKGYRIVSLG